LIEEAVQTVEEHERWHSRGSYKPERCPLADCGSNLHAHGSKPRVLKGMLGPLALLLEPVVLLIAIYRCPRCGAVWRVLPGFVPRWLHSPWSVVRETVERAAKDADRVSPRTRRRWVARLWQRADLPVQVLATSGSPPLREIAGFVGLLADRARLVAVWSEKALFAGCSFGSLAGLLHRLAPGVRLM